MKKASRRQTIAVRRIIDINKWEWWFFYFYFFLEKLQHIWTSKQTNFRLFWVLTDDWLWIEFTTTPGWECFLPALSLKEKTKKSIRFGISCLFWVTNKMQERIFGTLLPSDPAPDDSKTHPGRFAASDFHWQLWTVRVRGSSCCGGREKTSFCQGF